MLESFKTPCIGGGNGGWCDKGAFPSTPAGERQSDVAQHLLRGMLQNVRKTENHSHGTACRGHRDISREGRAGSRGPEFLIVAASGRLAGHFGAVQMRRKVPSNLAHCAAWKQNGSNHWNGNRNFGKMEINNVVTGSAFIRLLVWLHQWIVCGIARGECRCSLRCNAYLFEGSTCAREILMRRSGCRFTFTFVAPIAANIE